MSPRQRNDTPIYANVQLADRNQIVDALARVSISSGGQWLRDPNPYASAAQQRIRSDRYSIPSNQSSDFAEYMAAGTFVHCGDAWSYLGRAVDALLRGDLHAAVHLTYYAELRGAISLLSAEGVYVGDYYTCVLDSAAAAVWVSGMGTHQSIWNCLQAWNQSPRSSIVLGSILRPGGVELDAWVSNLPGGAMGPLISDLLDRMKFDLQSFGHDRTRRNTASYNPSRLSAEDLQPDAARRIVSNVWSALEPGANGTFPVIDRLLLRDILVSNFSSTHKVFDVNGEPTDETDWDKWEIWLDDLIPTQALSTALYDDLTEVPNETIDSSFLAAAFADQQVNQNPVEYIEGMLIRATILLRLATGSCVKLLKDSGTDSSEIHPWADSLSIVRGLWPVGGAPDNKQDLWADTEIALEALDEDESEDLYGLLRTLAIHLPTFGQAERVVAWSFA